MTILIYFLISLIFGAGVYFLLSGNGLLGIIILSQIANLLLLLMAELKVGLPAFVGTDAMVDPLPQALILTAIVISFSLTILTAGVLKRAQDTENPARE